MMTGHDRLSASHRSLTSGETGQQSLRLENEKLKQYLQDYESQIKDLESELGQLK